MRNSSKTFTIAIVNVIILLLIIAVTWKDAKCEFIYEKSVRGASIGYGFAALADEPAGVYYNPAGIAYLQGSQVSTMFNSISDYGLGNSDEFPFSGDIGGYKRYDNYGSLAFNIYRMGSLSSNSAINTTNQMILTFSRILNPWWAAGLNLKYTFESNYGNRKGADIDLGLLYDANEVVNVGFTVRNLFQTKMKPLYDGAYRYLDRIALTSLTYTTQDPWEPTVFAFALGIKQQAVVDRKIAYGLGSFGVEQWFRYDMPFSWILRGSYTVTKDDDVNFRQFSAGFGLRFRNGSNFWRIDYAFQKYPYDGAVPLTGNHVISLVYGFGCLDEQY
ncbi:MAG: hypothetical protein GF315_10720 [candidate division Zixibacteria bacterium]|nr:hypothetical protein [candidate division Zixibacteria bacterium]